MTIVSDTIREHASKKNRELTDKLNDLYDRLVAKKERIEGDLHDNEQAIRALEAQRKEGLAKLDAVITDIQQTRTSLIKTFQSRFSFENESSARTDNGSVSNSVQTNGDHPA